MIKGYIINKKNNDFLAHHPIMIIWIGEKVVEICHRCKSHTYMVLQLKKNMDTKPV